MTEAPSAFEKAVEHLITAARVFGNYDVQDGHLRLGYAEARGEVNGMERALLAQHAADIEAAVAPLQAEIDLLKRMGDNIVQGIKEHPDGKTIIDFLKVWLEQARDGERKARSALLKADAERDARIKELEDALRPFAHFPEFAPAFPDPIYFRRARSVLPESGQVDRDLTIPVSEPQEKDT